MTNEMMVKILKKERKKVNSKEGKLNTLYAMAKEVPAAIVSFSVCTDGGNCKMMTPKGEEHTIWTFNTRGRLVLPIVLYRSKSEKNILEESCTNRIVGRPPVAIKIRG